MKWLWSQAGLTLVGALLLTGPLLATESAPTSDSHVAYWSTWLDEVAALITPAERDQFLSLSSDWQRRSFRRAFWRARDPEPDTAGNPARERFARNVQFAWDAIGSLQDARAQTIVLHGAPRFAYPIECASLHPVQLFYFGSDHGHDAFSTLYVRPQDSSTGYRLWRGASLAELVSDPDLLATLPVPEGGDPETPPTDAAILERLASQGCFHDREHLLGYLNGALEGAVDWAEVRRRSPFRAPRPYRLEEASTRESPSLSLSGSPPLSLDFFAPANQQGETQRTVVQGVAHFDILSPDADLQRWILRGEFLSRPAPDVDPKATVPRKETFHQILYPKVQDEDEGFELRFFRDLTPGHYLLLLQVESPDGAPLHESFHSVVVPPPDALGQVDETTRDAARSPAVRTALHLQVPAGVLAGTVEVSAGTTGRVLRSVRYLLDGEVVAHTTRRPWSATIDLGPRPTPRRLRAEGLDRSGTVVASDERELNVGRSRFSVLLTEPWPGAENSRALRARARVQIPPVSELDRVEFFLGDVPLGTHFQPPYLQTIPAHSTREPTFVRVVAHLRDGRSTSDVALINTPGHLDEIEVQEVELFAKFLRRRRVVEDLEVDEIELEENDIVQSIERFEHVRDLPVHLGLVIDSSTSMLEELPVCVESALVFFRETLEEDDQAAVVTFNQRTHYAVPLTSDLEWLSDGVSMLHPRGGTALWDGLIDTLDYFGGLPGKKALVLISDGGDQHSRFSFEDSLEFARHSGIAVYTFFLNVSATDPNGLVPAGVSGWSTAHINPSELSSRQERQARLATLAEETGGLSFLVSDRRSIEKAFAKVAKDVRSQYRITYQSSNQGKGFRRIEIETRRPGVRVRTLRGYYP